MSCDRFPTYSKLLLVVAVVFRCLFLLVLFPRSSRNPLFATVGPLPFARSAKHVFLVKI